MGQAFILVIQMPVKMCASHIRVPAFDDMVSEPADAACSVCASHKKRVVIKYAHYIKILPWVSHKTLIGKFKELSIV